ncbi:carbohydrate sulfotransferase 9-like isoform X2 [Pecten maximus]|uniref:carbohydrate sulfotransferase 9-like isoform X2 n=1 Tax=Pecten maximus TaxID=6579 RepID=UPI001459104F|nr:carbohydrate sulfotransferase 9-like isoform X2 [Pecten maximus]
MLRSLTKGIIALGLISLVVFVRWSYNQQKGELLHESNVVYSDTNLEKEDKQTDKNIAQNNNRSVGEDVYKVRRDRITKMCAENRYKFVGRQGHYHDTLTRIIIDRKQRLAYCAVQKSASTFWKRVFRIVNGNSAAASPFDPSVSADLMKFDSLRLLPENQRDAFTEKALSFMFVREPYGRLFSGYIDKLFSPNVIFWKSYGAFAVSVVRGNPSKMDLNCGHDITFREFVKTVLYDEKHNIRRNGHFTPQYEHCDICHYKYDIIGKLETLSQDTIYLLDRMGKTSLRKSLENDFHGQSLNDTIYDQVKLLFLFRKRFRECGVSFFEAQKLMWKKFQIRGIISKNSKYPITREKSEGLTREILTELIYKGIGDARDKNVAKKNKNDALLEAFSTLDKEDMDRLSKMFEPDCELFDYDCRPSKLFDINSPIKPWYFDINTV